MNTSFNRLIADAKKSCLMRGHKMDLFLPVGNSIYLSKCLECGKYVQVNNMPMPNEIDIGGDAVAINCMDDPGRRNR